jgi:hypothetical protein
MYGRFRALSRSARRGYDEAVTDPTEPAASTDPTASAVSGPPGDPTPTDPAPADSAADDPAAPTPGERRLAHPPSDRYRAAEAQAAAAEADRPDPAASVARGLAIAVAIAVVGAAGIVVVGGVLSQTTGLVVVAGATGLLIAYALQVGAGDHLTSRRRIALAVGLTVLAIALGQLGVWQYARSEGGVLPLIDYLGEVFGLLVPLQFAAGIVAAALVAR